MSSERRMAEMPSASLRCILFLVGVAPTAVATLRAAACGADQSWVGTRVYHNVSVGADGNNERRFLMTAPPGNPTEPKPVLVAFHGYGNSAMQIAQEEKFDAIARKRGFVVVYPEGLDDVPDELDRTGNPFKSMSWQSWNSADQEVICNHKTIESNGYYPACYKSCEAKGLCKHSKPQSNPCYWSTCVDDEQFVRAMLDSISKKVCVDTSRIFGYGVSNGGMLLYKSSISKQFRALVIAKALPFAKEKDEQLHVPQGVAGVLQILASNDGIVPRLGGESSEGYLYKDPNSTLRALCGGAISRSSTKKSIDGLSCEEIEKCSTAQVVSCSFVGNHFTITPGKEFMFDFFDRFKSSDAIHTEAIHSTKPSQV